MYSINSTLRGLRHPNKKQKTMRNLVPITFAVMRARRGKIKLANIKLLLDSGASSTLIASKYTKNLKKQENVSPTKWTTTAGVFETKNIANVQMVLPEFHEGRTIACKAHVAKDLGLYDMIVGRDLLRELGIKIDFSTNTVEWDEAIIPMKPENATIEKAFYVQDSTAVDEATERIKGILDAKYEAADLDDVVTKSLHLNDFQRLSLKKLLEKYRTLFDGTLGVWKDTQYEIELKEGATPYHARAYPIPKSLEATLRLEVERLLSLGVLKKVNRSEWAAPTFIIPKKDGSVRFISDFRQLNLRIKRKPFPIPHIQDLLLKLEGFQYATSLDLNMGYYHIELSPNSRALCTIVLPWGKYEYQRLPMGLCNSPDIFQEKMSSLMQDLEYCRAYIDDLLILTKGDWKEHLRNLDTVLSRLREAGLKVNAKKSFFGRSELEYLGYWITREGIQPVTKKVQAIQNIAVPKTKKDLRRFVGMVNYYRDMWVRRSDVLGPLTTLCSKTAKWQWTDEQQKAFELMKKIIGKETLLSYPNFNKPFDIHTDASHTQLGAVLSQDGRPIAFYSRKLSLAQTRYTTTERELLAIVETLKEFRNILLGQQIRVHTDHKNLTYKNFNTERVMRWRLILEEFGPELIYVQGETNIVADALSRLDIVDSPIQHSSHSIAELYGATKEDLPKDILPVTYHVLHSEQQRDQALLKATHINKQYQLKSFHGGGTGRTLICLHNKIVVPRTLQKRVVQWYHDILCHPGINRTEETIRQHFWWKNLREDVLNVCKMCDTCQRTKRSYTKYGHLPEKEAEATPWDVLCVDMIGPYTFKRQGQKPLSLWCVTMIDPATGWFEMKQAPNREAITVASIVEQTWLTRYPWPTQLIFDKGSEFMGDFAQMIKEDYGVKRRGTTTRNPRANAILERVHQTIGNIIRTFEVQDDPYLDPNDPWAGILAATMFAVRATYHTTLKATPTQLVFGRDAILNTIFEANWKIIRGNKQRQIHQDNMRENSKRIPHKYQLRDKVLCVGKPTLSKFGSNPWEGPYEIVKINNNGTVRLRKGIITETINIRNIKPYCSDGNQ
jgi:RNase H-like domain found in reverse transcriptase/Reverse transcriptase (RNA-dependent DNA polymerase)/Integrase zinc binding domain